MNNHPALTPTQCEAMRNADARLQRALNNGKFQPTVYAEAFKSYRFERYTELGFEALTGPEGLYHLTEAAHSVQQAADMLANGEVGIESVTARAKATLLILSKAWGWRHSRGAECLWEALSATGHQRLIETFHKQREAFNAQGDAHLTAASIVNGGTNHKAIAEVIWIFIDEMENLAAWLEFMHTPAGDGKSEGIRQFMFQASKTLRNYEMTLTTPARTQKKR